MKGIKIYIDARCFNSSLYNTIFYVSMGLQGPEVMVMVVRIPPLNRSRPMLAFYLVKPGESDMKWRRPRLDG